uniref:Uncharacterized protein n=1 Tax=Alexandrium monilatum TaxID=311494 RepID=A0A7S4VYB2_9DINO
MSGSAPVTYGELAFGQIGNAHCPYPFKGFLTLRCDLEGITVVAGRCARPCLAGSVRDGSFLVHYPPILHGETVPAPCPEGSQGSIHLRCTDEKVQRMGGRCGFNCPAGALKSGEAAVQYPAMIHDDVLTVPCPAGYGGQVVAECVDSLVEALSGRCDRHCDSGQVLFQAGNVSAFANHGSLLHGQLLQVPCGPSALVGGIVELLCLGGHVTTIYNASLEGCRQHCPAGEIGTGAKALRHGILQHGSTSVLNCMQGFGGQLTVQCDDGEVVVLRGECNFHCSAGTVTSNSVDLPHPMVLHGDNITLHCPQDTHSGTLDAICNDGAMTYSGSCGENCPAGKIYSNGAPVDFPKLLHKTDMTIACPYPWGSSVNVRCNDARTFLTGSCGRACQRSVIRMNGAFIYLDGQTHTEARNYSCVSQFPGSMSFSGIVLATCYDGGVTFTGACWPDCAPGSFINNGARVHHPKILADHEIARPCSPDYTYGTVLIKCYEGNVQVQQGSCGAPCLDNIYKSEMTRWWDLAHPTIPHGSDTWFDCPVQVSGRIKISCANGARTALEGNCGERCHAESFAVFGATFNSPMMDHGASYDQPCLPPFSGTVHVFCVMGKVNATSHCRKGCFASNISVSGGALVYTPDLAGGERVTLSCPAFFEGRLTVECRTAVPQVIGGVCNRHCKAGRWSPGVDAEWDVPYYEMMHGEVQERQCPEGMVGTVFLRCNGGSVGKDMGGCYYNCPSGRAFIRQGIVMRYAPMAHDQLLPNMLCPAGFVGSVRLKCFNGQIGVAEGGCFAHCPSGGVQGALFGYLLHNENASLVCPVAGMIKVRCFDGFVEVLSGECLKNCGVGQVPDTEPGLFIAHGAIDHETNGTGTCSGNAVGHKNVRCSNGVVTLLPLPGERCFKHCQNQTAVSPDGSVVTVSDLSHGQRMLIRCPGGKLGYITAQCFDSVVRIVDGSCGNMNCPAGEVTSDAVPLSHPEINDGGRGGPTACAAPYMGEAAFECRNGSTSIVDVTIWLPPWEIVTVSPAAISGPTSTTTTSTTTTTTTTTTRDAGPVPLEDSYRFTLCGCCVPPAAPNSAEPVPGVDYRIVLIWASAVGGSGLLIATFAGGYYFRPESWRRKKSRVAPDDKIAGFEDTPALALQDLSRQDLLKLKGALENVVRERQLLEDMEDVKGLQELAVREDRLRAALGLPPGSALSALSASGLQAALALEDSPKAPMEVPASLMALQDASGAVVAQGTVLTLEGLDSNARKKVTGFREGYTGNWRHWQ